MADVELTRFIDLEKFAKSLVKNETEIALKQAQRQAKLKVRVDKGTLRRSIQFEQTRDDEGTIFSTLPYARAQEYGIPGVDYGFTSYMRPSAKIVAAQLRAGRLTPAAVRASIREARI